MALDLFTQPNGIVSGTVTSDVWESPLNGIEVFARGGTQHGTITSSAIVYIDTQDVDGNWFNAAGGSIPVGLSANVTKWYKRGAVDPYVLGVKQRARIVVTGSMAFGMNVVGF